MNHRPAPLSAPSSLATAPAANDGADLPAYVELHCLSDFSFQRGASSARELFKRAAALGYTALAITDECSLAGIVRAWEASRDNGIRLIVGSELRLADGPTVVLLVENDDGYAELCRIITLGRGRCAKGAYHLLRTDLETLGPGLQVLWVPRPLSGAVMSTLDGHGDWLARHFHGRAWLAMELHRGPDDDAERRALEQLGERHGLPRIATGDVHMHARERRALQDVLTAIRLGVPVAEAGTALFPNGERHLRTRAVLATLYPRAWLQATCELAARCRFEMGTLNYVYPRELVPEGLTPTQHLRALTEAGARRRWPEGVPDKVRVSIEKELALIEYKAYEAFFLTVEDIVRYARSRGILCQGRGSAANSSVCYCLGITAVQPDKVELLFERFISRQRDEAPDIDVDFEHERREEVIQYVFNKYGRERAALAATVICYRRRSAARDIGRALGLDNDQLDQLSHAYSHAHGKVDIGQRLHERGFDPDSPLMRRLAVLVEQLRGMPRHLSQHVGGFVISEHPLHHLVPVENAAMAGRTVIQWDKDDLESLGLLKVDCLALGMLTCLRKSRDLLKQHCDIELDLARIKPDDATYEMIQKADTIGTFQIESRAQMSMLPRLRPANYYDLVVQVAIVRPGPIQGGMVHPYLKRRNGEEPVEYPSDAVRDVLGRTLGVPIFQEQVMKLLEVAAGFSADEADHVRRSMAAWKRHGGLEHFEQRIHEGMARNGYPREFSERIYQQILGFGSYGFPESHAASFALLAYASCWLKKHHPAVYACALLNSQPMGFYAPAQIIQDLRRHRTEVRAVDIDHSHWDCSLEKCRDDTLALRLGWRQVKGLSQALAERIDHAREQAPFTDVGDLCRRATIDRRECQLLARSGALRRLSGHRHRAYWDSAGIERRLPLLDAAEGREQRITLRPPSVAEDMFTDYASMRLSLQHHPLALVRATLTRRRTRLARDIAKLPHGVRLRHAGLVTVRQRPGTANGVTFVTLEDETGQINVVVWQRLAERQRRVLLDAVLLGVDGELQESEGVRHLIAHRLHDWSTLLPTLDPQSRDFH